MCFKSVWYETIRGQRLGRTNKQTAASLYSSTFTFKLYKAISVQIYQRAAVNRKTAAWSTSVMFAQSCVSCGCYLGYHHKGSAPFVFTADCHRLLMVSLASVQLHFTGTPRFVTTVWVKGSAPAPHAKLYHFWHIYYVYRHQEHLQISPDLSLNTERASVFIKLFSESLH